MPPSHDPHATDAGVLDDEVIELEPTTLLAPIPDQYATATHHFTQAGRPSTPVAFVEGSMGSLTGETHDLRRERLKAAAIALAAIFGMVMVWVYESNNPGTLAADGSQLSPRVILIGLRCLLAAAVAGLLASEAPLSQKHLRVVEYVLFLGLTALMVVSQYVIGLDLIRRGPDYVPILLAFVKDGVIQMLTIMMIYGTLIPNRPAIAARTLLLMFAGPVVGMFLIRMHPESVSAIEMLAAAEEAGSNILFLAIGAVLSYFAAHVLNGLRAELHDARKFGQYRLLKKIGAGGMGEVYMAEHQLLKRPCALKLIKPASVANPTALARFEREVRSAARLSHPNSIEIYDYGHSEDGTFYYVMEYLPGMSLEELVRKIGPLPPGRAIYLLRQACAGLAEAHAIGLVHRDLKPANIFVVHRGGETDVAKVLDFGLVKPTQDLGPALTADMTVSGTPTYMAPEQATGSRDLDVRADVYALGAVAYFTLTGQPPFSGDSSFAVMMAHARDPVPPPSEVRPGIPADLEAVVLKALAKKPADRYPDARAMGRALAACEAAHDWDADRADQWWAEARAAAEVDTVQAG
jgi:eukaryotic-like serine/threonine-protein kinase